MGLFLFYQFYGFFFRDEMGRFVFCLIFMGGFCYFCGLFYNVCLFVFDSQVVFGVCDDYVDIFFSGKIKLIMEFY